MNELKLKDVIEALEELALNYKLYNMRNIEAVLRVAITLLREKDAEIADVRTETIDDFLAQAYAKAREIGSLKPFITIEDLEKIAEKVKEEIK